MTQAFYTGINGLQNSSLSIDAISDNLANIDTVGYRGYNLEFSNLFEEMVTQTSQSSSVDSSIGIGANVQVSATSQAQGSLILTDRSTDLAIDGDGWFAIQADGEPLYTRDGSFLIDSESDMVTAEGFHVLGTMGGNIDANTNTLTSVLNSTDLGDINAQEKLNFPKTLSYPSVPTANASFTGNIGTDAIVRTMSAGVVDGQNNKNELKLTFTKSAVQTPPGTQWDVVAQTQTLDGTTIYDTQNGNVTFDASGALVTSSLSTIDNNGISVSIDLGSGFNGVVAIANLPISSSSSADGTIGGDLQGYDININGEVIATFTNGLQSSVGRVAIFHFQNDQGLERISGAKFRESTNSGEALIFQDADGNNVLGATLVNHKLENSNYQIQVGLTDLIIMQRMYDSNSKVVTTADQMIQKALNMDA